MAADAEARVRLSLIDRVTGPLRRIRARIGAISGRLGFNRIAQGARGVGRALSGMNAGLASSISRLGAIGGLVGLGGAGIVAGLWGLARSVAAVADETAKTARQLGIGAEALQEWRYAAELSGVSSSTLETSLKAFGRRSGEAASGNKAMAKTFKALGVSIRDASGNIKDTDALFSEVAGAIGDIENPLLRSKYAMDLFGRSGLDMVRIFGAGSEGMRQMREEARKTGHVVSQEAAEYAEAFDDNVTRLQRRLEGLRNLVGVSVMPTINNLVVSLTAWFDANSQLVRSTITRWAERLSRVVRDLLDPTSELRQSIADLATGFGNFVDRIRPVVDFLGGPLNAALLGAAAFILGPMALALATLGTAFIQLGVIIMTTPIGWIMAALAAVAASVYVLYQEWDSFTAYWAGLWDRVKGAFDRSFVQGILAAIREFNPLTHILRGINEVVRYLTGVDLLAAGDRLIMRLYAGIVTGFEDLAAWGAGVADRVESWFGVDLVAPALRLVRSFFDGLAQGWAIVAAWASAIADTVRGWFSIDLAAIGAAVIDTFLAGLKSAWSGVTGWLSDSVAGLKGMVPDFIASRIGLDVAPPTVTAPSAGVDGGGVPVGPTVTRSGPIAPGFPAVASAAKPFARVAASADRVSEVKAQTVEASSVDAKAFVAPEPLLVHQPQQIDASTQVGDIHLHGVETNNAGAVRAAIDAALRDHSRRQAAAAQSSLSDQ